MTVEVIQGEKFDGVDFGNAPGIDPGYVIGYTPVGNKRLLHIEKGDESASLVGVKYYHHAEDDVRGEDARPPDEVFALTMLVSEGEWKQRVWREGSNDNVEVLLTESGDFIAWEPGLSHSWKPGKASTMLTIRWKRSEK